MARQLLLPLCNSDGVSSLLVGRNESRGDYRCVLREGEGSPQKGAAFTFLRKSMGKTEPDEGLLAVSIPCRRFSPMVVGAPLP